MIPVRINFGENAAGRGPLRECIKSAKARPTALTSLQRAILSHFNQALSAEAVAEVLEALTAAGHVVVNGKKVTYPDRG
jgi:hypothetical protein